MAQIGSSPLVPQTATRLLWVARALSPWHQALIPMPDTIRGWIRPYWLDRPERDCARDWPSVPAQFVRELIDSGKNQPGKLTYGSGGVGGRNHFPGFSPVWRALR